MRTAAECFHVRNTLTYLSLFSSLLAIAAAQRGLAAAAGALLATAVIADTFDGRFARRFGHDVGRRAFGAQLDSLADAIAFGLAPVVCAWLVSPGQGPIELAIAALAGFVYAACAITRLGHFTLAASDADGFVGLPVPVAALIWSTALLARPTAGASAVLLIACAAAMVSPFRIPRPRGARLAAFVAWPLLLIVAHLA